MSVLWSLCEPVQCVCTSHPLSLPVVFGWLGVSMPVSVGASSECVHSTSFVSVRGVWLVRCQYASQYGSQFCMCTSYPLSLSMVFGWLGVSMPISVWFSLTWLSAQHTSCFWSVSVMVRTVQATARFQDSEIIQKTLKMALRCILSVNSHLSGFKLSPGLTHAVILLVSLSVCWLMVSPSRSMFCASVQSIFLLFLRCVLLSLSVQQSLPGPVQIWSSTTLTHPDDWKYWSPQVQLSTPIFHCKMVARWTIKYTFTQSYTQ